MQAYHFNTIIIPVRFSHQPIQQNPIMHSLGHMGGQGVHPGMRPNQMLAEQQQQQQQQQQAAQQQQQYLRQQALRVSYFNTIFNDVQAPVTCCCCCCC